MLKSGSIVAAMTLLIVGALALRPTPSAGQGQGCAYEAWGQVSGGHYDCLGTACVPSICCKICPVLPEG
jgi:hypothetical protein